MGADKRAAGPGLWRGSRADIAVRDANPAFDLTHEKSMVVDEKAAFVKSLNWTTKNLTETRD